MATFESNNSTVNTPVLGASDHRDDTTANLNEDANKHRLARTTACLPIVYGSVAFFLGKKADEYNTNCTHKWTLYVRGPNNQDFSGCINKVIFQLHPSFTQPVREIKEPPYEVTERGWGEFEAQIRIIWKDPLEQPTVVNHGIKLYPPGSTNMQPTKEPVVSERYDEVVFTDPKETFYQQLVALADSPPSLVQSADPAVQACFGNFQDEADVSRLVEARKFLSQELRKVKERIKVAQMEMSDIDNALRDMTEAKAAVSHPPLGGRSASTLTGKTKQTSHLSPAPLAKKARSMG